MPTSSWQVRVGKGENADRALAAMARAMQDRNQELDGQVRTSSTPYTPSRPVLQPTGMTMLYGASIGRSYRTIDLTKRQKLRIKGWAWHLTQLVRRIESGESTQAEERGMVHRIRWQWQTVEQWLSE